MTEESQGIEWPALAVDPSRLEPFVESHHWWSPWKKTVELGALSPDEASRQFEAWAQWLESLLGDEVGVQAAMGIKLGVALLRPQAPTPIIMMNAIAGLLRAIEREVGYLRWKLTQATPSTDS